MREVPYHLWHRYEHAEFVGKMGMPFLQAQHTLDVTHFRKIVKAQQTSFYFAMIWASTKVIESREDFRWRLRGDRVALVDSPEPSFTDIMAGTELYKVVNAGPVGEDMLEYAMRARRVADAQQVFFPGEEEEAGDAYTYFSSTPLQTFSVLCQPVSMDRDNFIPALAWSRFWEEDGRTLLAYTALCNHRQVDGLHVARFFTELQEFLNAIE